MKNTPLQSDFSTGLHKGHQTVINKAIEKANELSIRSAVMTFNPHPSHILGGGRIRLATSHHSKKRLDFGEYGG